MVQQTWAFKFSPDCEKEWIKLAPPVQAQILNFLHKRLLTAENPRIFAKPLSGNLKNLWRLRIGD